MKRAPETRAPGRAPEPSPRGLLAALVLASGVGLGLRLYAAVRVGFGDSEALYAAYALHPAPAYLDHPGLIGLVARALGSGGAPSPVVAHRFTAVAATLAPWLMVLAGRAVGAAWRGALGAGLAVAVVPEVALGLFAMTPDLLLFPAWVGALACAGAALLAPPSSVRASGGFALAGLAVGVGLAAKASAIGLFFALVVTYASKAARAHGRTIWPWAGLALALLIPSPVAAYEAQSGWPMLRHRLVETQGDAGVSIRNLGALVGGQLGYLSPVVAVLAVLVAIDLFRARRTDALSVLLASAVFVPLALLVPLCLWSKVAEPHWIAPALLALPLRYSVGPVAPGPWAGRRVPAPVIKGGMAFAAAMSLAAYVWTLVPRLAALVPEGFYDRRLDISNELYGWPEVTSAVREVADRYRSDAPARTDIALVGPHWVISAQLAAALGDTLTVGCVGPDQADFASWSPREAWDRADLVVFVTDNRFPVSTRELFPRRVRAASRTLEVRRGGHVARVFTIELLRAREIG